jgi:hypothetical protein
LKGLPIGGLEAENSRVNADPQTSGTVLMVQPARFGFHAEAADSNVFARASANADSSAVLREFDSVVEVLDSAGVEVLVLEDPPEPAKPDAVFPNNWVTFHADGTMVLYPMATAARRLERDPGALRELLGSKGFEIRQVVDLSFHERNGHFLEGTGSLVLDRPERRAYANLSPRTDATVIADFDDRLDYSTLLFDAHDRSGRPIYHTNVAMAFGRRFAVLCTDAIGPEYREILIGEIETGGRTVIQVDYDQMCQFACNLIELEGRSGPVIALSAAARRGYRPEQLRSLEGFGELVDADIPTIEAVGGGSVRCMITDVHLPRINQAT